MSKRQRKKGSLRDQLRRKAETINRSKRALDTRRFTSVEAFITRRKMPRMHKEM